MRAAIDVAEIIIQEEKEGGKNVEDKGDDHSKSCWKSDKSLYLFNPESKVRRFFTRIIEHRYFEDFIYHLIAMNSLLLMINYPNNNDPYFIKTIELITTLISAFFLGEAFSKIISLGFFIGEGAYLKDSWNILDFIIVLSSILNWILDAFSSVSLTFLRGFRAMRALRPLRMISKDEGMKTIVNSLLKAIPSLFNVALINILFLVVFGILGVQIFKGQIGYCNDLTQNLKKTCTGNYNNDSGALVSREWIVPFNNFDNILWSMITFFELATLEAWPTILLREIDS